MDQVSVANAHDSE